LRLLGPFPRQGRLALGPSDLDVGTGDFQLGLERPDAGCVLDALDLGVLSNANPGRDASAGVELPCALALLSERAAQAGPLALEVGHRYDPLGMYEPQGASVGPT